MDLIRFDPSELHREYPPGTSAVVKKLCGEDEALTDWIKQCGEYVMLEIPSGAFIGQFSSEGEAGVFAAARGIELSGGTGVLRRADITGSRGYEYGAADGESLTYF